MSYKPPYTITPKITNLVAQISEAIGSYYAHENLRLHRVNRIKTIHGTLAIEGNTLSTEQVTAVLEGKPVVAPINEVQEVRNALKAYELLDTLDPCKVDDLLKAHATMEVGLIDEIGCFRKGGAGVVSGKTVIHYAPDAERVPFLVNDLFEWLRTTDEHPLIASCVFHYEFEFIHPFADGNGRMARLWHTALLSKWKPIFEYIPLESQTEKFQDEYYNAIAACHGEGPADTFIEFMLRMIDSVLDELAEQIARADDRLPLCVKKLMDHMEYDTPYTAAELMQRLELKSRNALRNNYLSPAMRLGLVVMTIPDKPNSRNQRYIKI